MIAFAPLDCLFGILFSFSKRSLARLGETHCSHCHPERETSLALGKLASLFDLFSAFILIEIKTSQVFEIIFRFLDEKVRRILNQFPFP